MAETDGKVTVLAASERLGVSEETIRRDLKGLRNDGRLHRVHGGAVPVDRLKYEPLFAKRLNTYVEEKSRIAAAAVSELPEEGVVMIDAGTTPRRFAELFPSDRRLTVVTNALPVAATLLDKANVTVVIVGGRAKPDTLAIVDYEAVKAISELGADVAFMGTDGMTIERGLTTHARDEARTKAAMIKSSRRCVVLADNSKYANEQFATFAELSEVDTIITDDGLSDTATADLESAGLSVVRA